MIFFAGFFPLFLIMDLLAVQLLCLEQEQRSFEDHTKDFLDLACLTNFSDHSLCAFSKNSLNEHTKARLLGDDPLGNFGMFVEWVLVNSGLDFTICPAEEDTEPSQMPPKPCTEHTPEHVMP